MLNSHNTKTKSETLGDVELKYISYDDTIEFAKILQETLKDRDFVFKMLFRQLIKPEINFGDFQKISDIELEALAKVFVKNENYTFKYFQDTGNYFNDFKQALTPIHEKYIVDEKLRKTYEPIIKSAQESLNVFNKTYEPIIKSAQESLNAFNKNYEPIIKSVQESLNAFNKNYASVQSIIKNTI